MNTASLLLEAEGVTKSFNGVTVLHDGRLRLKSGTVHALCGGNGAGKSTFLNILMGLLPRDGGTIRVKGKDAHFDSASEALRHGIAIITQELSPVPEMTVAENLYLGREPRRAGVFVDFARMRADAAELLERLKFDVPPDAKMRDLSLAKVQLVEIAKALSYEADIVIMDEPTSAIGENETHVLFDAIRLVKAHGSAIIYVSHRLTEIFEIADEYTVFRDGCWVESGCIADIDRKQLVTAILGHELTTRSASAERTAGEPMLRTVGLSQEGCFDEISLQVRAGEVVGIYGLLGSGRTEFLEAVYGTRRPTSGHVEFCGGALPVSSPRESIRRGIAMVSEDRKQSGIIPAASIRHNISLSTLKPLSRFGVFIDRQRESSLVSRMGKELLIKAASYNLATESLSGGNQQKVVFARCLSSRPKLLICDEPTRGIDEGAKQEIYSLMRKFVAEGGAVLLVSSEAPEILEVSDRIVIFKNGRTKGELPRSQATQQVMLDMAA
ncbi:sugar ABC transporter ATP-binding protein [Variovorax ureilyticus]|uniref:Sugar ABC transporter ATP-binding protein n=1 Tax=Variovorax ureilyticus TaxID=1836198 RepID=A0ABU8VPH9_9BURK